MGDGLELAVRFSFITNKLAYCGPGTAHHAFLRYLRKKDNAGEVRSALVRFEGLWPYLSAIGKKSGRDPFDEKVVEAYWVGNSLLEPFTREDNAGIIRELVGRGLPKSFGRKLITRLPGGLVPHHSFNVFYVGVGMTTGSVPTTLQNMDNCRISWGEVIDVQPRHLAVKTRPLILQNKAYALGEEEVRTAQYLPQMLHAVKGDVVALHWGFAGYALSKKQARNLQDYTKRIFTVMSKTLQKA